MSYNFQYDVRDGVATVTFDRPEVLNALTFEIYAQFRDLLEALRYDDAVKVLVLTGADMGSAYLLPRVVGQRRALELLLFGDAIDAPTAERYGLVNRVVPHDDLLETAHAWARRLADGPSLALAMTKRMVNNEWNMDMVSALEAEAQAQALLMMGEDHRIFYEAFREKAQPKFSGR